ncbi:MAG TPA: hypothetical protein VJ024_05425 [Thermodesulfovibrionales bacterium]|nr:hypothetical protein [Thermodesulfovibrionales bacterium]
MVNLKNLISHVKRNCNISDAKYWGFYSMCGLLLRLRDLYRFERVMRPWEKFQQEEISDWLSEREDLWKELEDEDFENIMIGDNAYGLFDLEEINAVLEKERLIYGAGYGVYMKPSFFLADLLYKRNMEGHIVYIAGSEYVRDLSYSPAMFQNGIIFARMDATRHLLWEKFEELKAKRSKSSLAFAFSKYGLTPEDEPSEDTYRRISLVALSEVETYIHHEIGEAFEGEKLGDEWEDLLIDFSSRKAELFVRSVKDLLSDTSEKGMIKHIIEKKKEGSLGFYTVFLGGYQKLLFPEIKDAVEDFVKSGDWGIVEDVRIEGYKRALRCAERLISLKRDKTSISEYIEQEILDRKKA